VTQTLLSFFKEYGISAMVRRHFGYRKPISDSELGGYPTRGALTYTRAIERSKMGLLFLEAQKAFNQGRQLKEMGIIPKLIIAGNDQRNEDGANATAEAFDPIVKVVTSPGVTYPHYFDFTGAKAAMAQYGDMAVHRNMAGKLENRLWTETPVMLDARLTKAIYSEPLSGPLLYDLNFEQVTLLYFRTVAKMDLADIPYDDQAWQPRMGGGVVYSADRTIAREFTPDLTIV
jgi:hypothetical protein